ncbi:cell division protein FtsB [Vibrio gazogenes]|jgi:cell division protein FtsB|uniref:Cell division protein FtsB n=1 Tax=Vibrio gazogenes DSM 21264 = NBRC 103151 TaxID=1123492 RepID=A0A1M4WG01_VIBGA|nr:cell division protein FtsB [Vibrio gazogenes]USP15323.1 cell division protein FtsB [Vibrio gazogenes]SHE80179.1 cell division protein FtsB [Vibrio gazogenes DSM 21264] [Vibrio gazogenes DSM 21264 = NBRC 103151]SJN54368.1 Cell division protein FtsB [Vibrio gazogenes]
MRVFALTLTLFLIVLQYSLWFGKNGISDFHRVSDEIKTQRSVNVNLQKRNKEMYAEIDDLSQGLDAVEERARHELGMVKEGETFYRVINEDRP